MEKLEIDIQKKLSSFCTMLPSHVAKWKSVLIETDDIIKAVINFVEQMKYVDNATVKFEPFLSGTATELEMRILENFEEELCILRNHIELLNKSNYDLKTALMHLERLTFDIDWECDSPLMKGNPRQPPLRRILQLAYEFLMCFTNRLKEMNDNFKTINIRDDNSIESLKNSFDWNMDNCRIIHYFLAVTQYINNEKAVS